MLEYSTQMLAVSTKAIDAEAETIVEQKATTNRARLSDVLNPQRSKSSSESSGGSRKPQNQTKERKNKSSQRDQTAATQYDQSTDKV